MAKKVDLEAAFRTCTARCAAATRAEAAGDYAATLAEAHSTLPLLRENIAYLRRYQQVEAPHLPSIELILRYAPPLFARRSLDALGTWLAQLNRSERAAYSDLPDRLEAARQRLSIAVRIWPSWRAAVSPAVNDPAEVARLLTFWAECGAIVRRAGTNPPQYELVTHPRRSARAKCARCGREQQAAWAEFLDTKVCPHCRAESLFAIVARVD